MLAEFVQRDWPIIVHPDAITSFASWQGFGELLLIENMDKRKPIGRTTHELRQLFHQLPRARLCFDIAHARQCDSSMTESYLILKEFGSRIAQVHISEVGTQSRHVRISSQAARDYQEVASLVPDVPVILETPVDEDEVEQQMEVARRALGEPVYVAS